MIHIKFTILCGSHYIVRQGFPHYFKMQFKIMVSPSTIIMKHVVVPWRAVTLDATGTLLRPREAIGATYVRFFQETMHQQLSSERSERAAAHINCRFPLVFEQQAVRKPNFGRAMNGDGGSNERPTASAWWSELILDTLPAELSREMSDDDARQFTTDLYAFYATGEAWHVFDDVRPTLDALCNQGVPLGVISNFDERLDAILRDLALREYFEVVTTSWAHGEMKPHASIFTSTFAALLNRPGNESVPAIFAHDVLHVGDHRERDYHGSRAVGAQARWLQRHPKDPADVNPRHIIPSLHSVLLAENEANPRASA